MPLTLITGPANAAKAGAVLDRLRAALPRDPLLVVPTAPDVEHYQRELAASGIVFGAEVLTFARLVREIAARTGLEQRPLGRVARDRVVRAAIADVPLRALARSAATPGFAVAAGALFAELQRSLVTPARFTSALRAWAGDGGRATYAGELGALYSAYRRRLERIGRPDREGYAWAALDALRADPAAWGGRPVFLYGFDDLTPIQRDAVETLARNAGVDVLVALPYEPGRVAFAGRAATVEELRPLADVVALPERSEYYAASARPALHHLERSLFEPEPVRRPPNGAVRLLEAGGERAEAELVGAAVLELMRQGIEPADVAVLLRGDAATAALFAQMLAGYGIPVSNDRRVPLERTRLGAGVLAGARAALPGGSAGDLLAWLRTPGRLAEPALADALELRVRRGELRDARAARAVWESRLGGPPLDALDALAEAAAAGAEPLLEALAAEADAIWTAPHRRRAQVLAAEDLADARVAADLRAAVAELAGLAALDAALVGGPQEVLEALGAVEVREPSSIAGAALGTPAETVYGGRLAGRRPLGRSRRARRPRRPSPPAPRPVPARRPRRPSPPAPRPVPARRPRASSSRTRTTSGRGASARSSSVGCRTARSRAGPSRSRSCPTRIGAGSWLPPACGCRCTRTCSIASGRCSTRRSRARRTSCSCRGGRPTRRATRSRRRRSSTTCARCSPTTSGRGVGRACWPTSRGGRAKRRRRTSCAAPTPPRQTPANRRRWGRPPPARCWSCSAPATRSPRAASSRSPRAAYAGSSSSCSGPAAPSPIPNRCAAARSPTPCSSAR